MPTYTNDFAELLDPGLRVIYGDKYNEYPEEYSQVFEVDTSTKHTETDFSLSGFGLAQEMEEGKGVAYDEMYKGFSNSYTHTAYGLGFIVTRIMYEDDLYRIIKAKPQALARSVRHTIEIDAAADLNNAFTSGLGGDGKYLCATDHPTRVGTLSNAMNPAADFSVTSLEQALIDIQGWTDDRGLKIRVMAKKLVIAPANVFQSKVVLKSAQLPGTPNNDINPVQNELPQPTVLHWLTDADAWFITTDVPNGLIFFWRRRPEFTRDNDFDSENAKFKTTYRCSHGWTDWRGIYGSTGA